MRELLLMPAPEPSAVFCRGAEIRGFPALNRAGVYKIAYSPSLGREFIESLGRTSSGEENKVENGGRGSKK